jgi:hypothetical protein
MVWIFAIFLISLSVNAARITKDDSLNVFSASIVDQAPPVIPAIALEQRSDARVKLFISVSPLALGNVEYEIEDLRVSLVKGDRSGLVRGVTTSRLINYEDMEYDNYFNPFKEDLVVADVWLNGIRGRGVRIVKDETAEKICSGEINDTRSISELIPDSLDLELMVSVVFRACKDGEFVPIEERGKTYKRDDIKKGDIEDGIEIDGMKAYPIYLKEDNKLLGYRKGSTIYDASEKVIGSVDKDENVEIKDYTKTKCSGILLTQRDYMHPESLSDNERLYQECLDRVERAANVEDLSAEQISERKKRCEERYLRRSYNRIVDFVFVDSSIGIDKTNLDRLIGPEELKKQICSTIKWKRGVDKWINKTKKAENIFQKTCLASILGASANLLIRGDVCDSRDIISLGCDWIFCPSSECNGVDPMSSIASSVMCLDYKKPFFNKELRYNVFDKEGNVKNVDVDQFKVLKEGEENIDYEPTCDYPRKPDGRKDTSGSIPVPHYACITSIEGNLEIISQMIDRYQECLINARLGGVSVGFCDKLRSYFLCDRVLGNVLAFTGESGTGGILKKVFSYAVGKPLDLILPGDSKKFFDDRRKAASDLMKLSIATYKNVPFIQIFGKEKEYLKNQVCYAFISGDLFSLEGMKRSLNLLDVDYPDSAFVVTEMRPWSYYNVKGKGRVVGEYSYDVFYQIYNGEKSIYSSGGYYAIYLTNLSSDIESINKRCKGRYILVDSGYVKKGELKQENKFIVHECRAGMQCLKFKNRYVCSPIGNILSFAEKVPYDPLGLTLFDKNDKDGDGFSDNWEIKYFGLNGIDPRGDDNGPTGDPDGDGYCNAEEYLKGTDPTNRRLHPITVPDCDGAVEELRIRVEKGETSLVEADNEKIGDDVEELNEDVECLGKGFNVRLPLYEDDYAISCDDVNLDQICELSNGEIYPSEPGNLRVKQKLKLDDDEFDGLRDEVRNACEEEPSGLNSCYEECKDDDGCICNVYGCVKEFNSYVDKGGDCGGKRDKVFEGGAITSYDFDSDFQTKVLAKASKYGVPIKLALSLVAQESGFRHCCKVAGETSANTCDPDYNTLECSENKMLVSPGGSSYGIMQINKEVHEDCFEDKQNSERSSDSICNVDECDRKSVRDIGCNIAAGLNLLKRNYNVYKDGCRESSVYENIKQRCEQCSTTDGFKFYNYGGWDAALRAYSGWGCRDDAEKDYVEDVRSWISKFENS